MSGGKARRVQTLIDTAEVKKALGPRIPRLGRGIVGRCVSRQVLASLRVDASSEAVGR
jgi:hypothetical protein